MKKTILIYGTCIGIVIISIMIWGTMTASDHVGFPVWLGYLIMLVALIWVFVGVKKYRDQELGGTIKFGQALLLGLGITLIASLVYVFVWEIYQALTGYGFIENYTAMMIKKAQEAGISDTELEALITKMDETKAQFANPVFRLIVTFSEIFPVGLIVSLISAAVLRFSSVLPARS